jgi:hypothetical protein
MASLTAERETARRDGVLLSVGMDKAVQTIWKGSLVSLDDTGWAVRGSDTSGHQFIGVAYETKVIATADPADGTTKVRMFRKGVFLFDTTETLDVSTDIGAEVCIVDDHTVAFSGTTTNDIKCGRIVAVESASQCWIEIDGYTPVATGVTS